MRVKLPTNNRDSLSPPTYEDCLNNFSDVDKRQKLYRIVRQNIICTCIESYRDIIVIVVIIITIRILL